MKTGQMMIGKERRDKESLTNFLVKSWRHMSNVKQNQSCNELDWENIKSWEKSWKEFQEIKQKGFLEIKQEVVKAKLGLEKQWALKLADSIECLSHTVYILKWMQPFLQRAKWE